MELDSIVVGPIQTNCYLLKSTEGNFLIIDPGDNPEKILEKVPKDKIKMIVSTHGHFDHITAAMVLKRKTDAKLLINLADSFMFPSDFEVDIPLEDGMEISLDDIKLKVISTPGHTPGSICLFDEKDKILFSGDTLFYSDHGRCDLPGSSYKDMVSSLKRIFKLPEDVIVYPGHGPKTNIKDEKNRGLI